ncbi:MAG TPA: arginine--tRNA ligase, partial [Bacteroidia bacterium]|nr:arginine--tRNA ligase [Bacteroidia bacterium]
MIFSEEIKGLITQAIYQLYNVSIETSQILIEPTKKEFEGDVTFVVFPYLKISKKSPVETAKQIGEIVVQSSGLISSFQAVAGFLNLSINNKVYVDAFLNPALKTSSIKPNPVLVEYSSPNTNKPLHLGHIRNILLGFSLSRILAADGNNIKKVNIVNDRGVHICKSMLAWQLFGNNETPESTGIKGDHLVGKYYVVFDAKYREQVTEMEARGISKDVAEKQAPLMLQVQEMLRKWETGDEAVLSLWQTMNGWVYDGFDITYSKLGVDFDEIYYESNTYLLGKEIVAAGLNKGVFFKKEDGSVWVDLTDEGLDLKLLQRSDGTSVYITQDLGTAKLRFDAYNFDKMIYVVGNEQDYHFKVLRLVFKKLGYPFWDKLYHMSYNMVDLPSGKMKSREGTVVDADDLIAQTIANAETLTRSMGKLDVYDDAHAQQLYHTIGMGALKYYILKVDPEKRMLFNPAESIDINGN